MNQFAQSAWARLGVFAGAAERERQETRDACQRAARGERFTPPRPESPGDFDPKRDDADDWLEATGKYLEAPRPEEHHRVAHL